MNRMSRRAFLTRSMLGVAGGATLALREERSALAQSRNDFTREELAGMEALATAFMAKFNVPALSVAITTGERLVYQHAFGYADRDKQEKVTPFHLFRIASVSKPITAVTLFRLIEADQQKGNGVKLTDKVFGPDGILGNAYGAPPYKKWVEDIRLEHLLTHTSGGWSYDGDPMFRNPEMNHQQLITWAIANIPLTHQPGTNFAYSNFGFCVLGRVIEKLAGKPYDRAVKELTLKPCQITGMLIAGNTLAQRAPNEVVYYGQDGEDPYGMQVTRMDSHGGWLATPTDLVRLLVRVDGFPNKPDILSLNTLKTMYTPTTANPNYAHGWLVNSVPNYWHNGSLPGTSTLMVRTARGLNWAALTNTRQPNSVIDGDLDRLMWDMVGKVKSWPSYNLFGG